MMLTWSLLLRRPIILLPHGAVISTNRSEGMSNLDSRCRMRTYSFYLVNRNFYASWLPTLTAFEQLKTMI